jgi:osmoprotectant transport system substrate-binding protein
MISFDRPPTGPQTSRVSRRTVVKGAAAAPLLGAGLLSAPRRTFAQETTLRVGSKDFTEEFILGYMYGLLLENAGFGFEDRTNLGGTGIAYEALKAGEIDLYPEYTGTGLTVILGITFEDFKAQLAATPAATAPEATPESGFSAISQAVYDFVAAELLAMDNIVLLDQSAFSDTQALAVTRAFSEEQGITTISQLAEVAGDLRISAPSDFPERQDGLLGLQAIYGAGFNDIEVIAVAPGIKYQAVEQGDAEVVLAFSTDAQIADLDLIVLEDDQNLWPPYHVAPFVRKDVLDANPGIADALNPAAPLLTNEVMQRLNARVDIDGEEPVDVARAFLQENGLIPA